MTVIESYKKYSCDDVKIVNNLYDHKLFLAQKEADNINQHKQ